jgi:hypothetical protein
MARYNREDLYEQVWTVPMTKLTKQYEVSDVALAKICRKLSIPLPGRGYWAKKDAKRPVGPRPPLPTVAIRTAKLSNGSPRRKQRKSRPEIIRRGTMQYEILEGVAAVGCVNSATIRLK